MGFGGGGFFGSGADQSQSTQTVHNTTTTKNASGGAQGDGAWQISSSESITLADPNLVSSAFKFASESLGLVERRASDQQKSFEGALSQTLNIADATKTAGSDRILILGGAALVAFVAFAYLVKS